MAPGLNAIVTIVSLLVFCSILSCYMSRSLLWPPRNSCDMSFMFQVPNFIEVKDVSKGDYKLYYYSEGLERSVKWDSIKLKGQPLLFLPGNAGSYKQMRSLASVALRKHQEQLYYSKRDAETDLDLTNLDVFGVDFREEFSGLYGGSLGQQAQFAATAIAHILNNYSNNVSMVVVGHSIGGLVAMNTMGLLDTNLVQRVGLLITLATPHAPLAILDWPTELYYTRIRDLWSREREKAFQHLTTISIAGGEQDLQVRPEVTTSPFMDLHALTTTSAGIWRSADHTCILWCRQLVLALTRAIFDAQKSPGRSDKFKIFDYHLNKANSGKSYKYHQALYEKNIIMDLDKASKRNGIWKSESGLKRQYSYSEVNNDGKDVYLILPLIDDSHHELLILDLVLESNHENLLGDWLLGCRKLTHQALIHDEKEDKNVSKCVQGQSLTANNTGSLPIWDGFVTFNLKDGVRRPDERVHYSATLHNMARHFQAIVVVLKSGIKARLSADFTRKLDRNIVIDKCLYYDNTNINLPALPKGALVMNITFPHLDLLWPAYKLELFFSAECQDKDVILATLPHLPIENNDENINSFILRVQMTKLRKRLGEKELPTYSLFLRCPLQRIEISSDFWALGNNLALIYFPQLPSAMLVAILSGISAHLQRRKAIFKSEIPMLLIVASLTHFLSYLLPSNDLRELRERGHYFWQLQLLLFSTALGIRFVSQLVLSAIISILSRFLNNQRRTPEMHPFLPIGLLLVTTMATCGALSLLGSVLVLLLKICAKTKSRIRDLHLNILLIYVLVAMLNLPSLLAFFTHGFKYDPATLVAVALALFINLINNNNENNDKNNHNLAFLLNCLLCVLSSLFASIHVYRIGHLVVAALICICVFGEVGNDECDPDKEDKTKKE